MIGFSVAFDWSREWCEFLDQSQCEVKQTSAITLNSLLKMTLLGISTFWSMEYRLDEGSIHTRDEYLVDKELFLFEMCYGDLCPIWWSTNSFFFKEINTFFPCYNRHNYLTALNCNDEDSVGSGWMFVHVGCPLILKGKKLK